MGLTHSSDGLGQGQEPPGICGEEAAPPEDAWGDAYNLLEGDLQSILPGALLEVHDPEDIILPE